MSDRWLFLEKLCVKDIKLRVRNKIIHSLPWIRIFGSLVMRFTNDFHSWLRHSWKSLANRLTRDPKIVIHGNSCIILNVITEEPHVLAWQFWNWWTDIAALKNFFPTMFYMIVPKHDWFVNVWDNWDTYMYDRACTVSIVTPFVYFIVGPWQVL